MDAWNAPYRGEEIREVRGIALPQDYMDFMRLHNGGEINNLKRRLRPGELKFPSWKLVFFSVEDILSGKKYSQWEGVWLGSEHSIGGTYPNSDFQIRTTRYGTPRGDEQNLYELFYDNHVVIGYYAWWTQKQYYRYDLIAIDKAGRYRVFRDGAAEKVTIHWFGTKVTYEFGSYMKYDVSLYDTPLGLMEFGWRKKRLVSQAELEEWIAKYDAYRGPGYSKPVEWHYAHRLKEPTPWAGQNMDDVLAFFHNGKRGRQ